MRKIRTMVVFVYGYEGSGPQHWQRWLDGELRQRGVPVRFPELPAPTAPQKDLWVAILADEIAALGDTPVTFVCHSLGCWAVDHLLAAHPLPSARAALLVAPPSPLLWFDAVDSFFPPPQQQLAWAPLAAQTVVVGSDNDDYASAEEFEGIAHAIGARCEIVRGAGHINASSGYGPWPWALKWVLAGNS